MSFIAQSEEDATVKPLGGFANQKTGGECGPWVFLLAHPTHLKGKVIFKTRLALRRRSHLLRLVMVLKNWEANEWMAKVSYNAIMCMYTYIQSYIYIYINIIYDIWHDYLTVSTYYLQYSI